MSSPNERLAPQATAITTEIEKLKIKLGEDRDRLRALIEDVDAILETSDQAGDCLVRAINEMNEAADELSKYL